MSNEVSSRPLTCSLLIKHVDETVVNGGQIFYRPQFGIDGTDPRSTWLTGLVNSAPYLCCAFIGCWLTVPFNNLFGRRGTIFITCTFSALACFWQGFVNSWWHLFIARFALGFGIGPKSATVPIYAAETTPPGMYPFHNHAPVSRLISHQVSEARWSCSGKCGPVSVCGCRFL